MRTGRDGSPWVWLRVALVLFVVVWILGPSDLRDRVPILIVFAIALGLELHFFVSGLRGGGPARAPDRSPQEVDRERYGFPPAHDDAPFHDDRVDDIGSADERDRVDAWRDAAESIGDDRGGLPVQEGETVTWAPSRLRLARRLALGVGVIAALAVLVWAVDSRTGWSSRPGSVRAAAVERFSREASRIAAKPVSVRCDTARDYVGAVQHADGVAVVGGDLAILTPEICDDLYRLAFQGQTTGSRTGRAIAVLAHEAWHLRGVRDEGIAECYALQSGVELGERLGLSGGRARQLMREQLIENELRGPDTLEYRLPPDCRSGGHLDLDPARASFP